MVDILFWSGGKDAYLALEFYQDERPSASLKLLTTYRESDESVPHQKIGIEHIKYQAEHLGLKLIPVPLPDECPNDTYLQKVDEALRNEQKNEDIGRLLFGDWHLEEIREWRELAFGELGYECLFPIWKKSLHDLLPVLLLKPVEVRINAVREEYRTYIRVGEAYNQRFVRQLPDNIDPMGENGEFHTKLTFQSWEDVKPEKQPLY